MKEQFEWREEFKIGIDAIDKAHFQLFKIINKLFELKDTGRDGQWTCQEGIKFFKTHAITHFLDEEQYMESIQYKGLERHRLIHQNFRDKTLSALEEELEQTGYSPDAVDHFLGVCAGWLIGHTSTEDLAIAEKQQGRWDKLLSGEEQKAMQQVIIQLLFDMFRLESQVISEFYGGERFGNGIYYHMIYGIPGEEKKMEVILAFEEQLLINTVGKALGIQTNKLDTMLIHAVRYTAQQFVSEICESFPSMEGYQLVADDLFSYRQLQQLFNKENPQVSLLLNTGAGYFAYCFIAPHLLEGEIGPALTADNATAEVEKYLAQRKTLEQQQKEHPQQKVLVVDDSATLREGMRQLLEKDYQVSTAESGISAIRSITLDRPDLVLMDYEMPICDGFQTLEMLRSEKAFADIPVIFLTGRRDTASMIKVMPLNPAGYLFKHAKKEEIKQAIDDFMAKQRG